MAVPYDPNKKPDDQTADDSSGGSGSETVLSKESSTANGDPSTDAAVGSTAKQGTSSGSFTNLQSYLSANADQGFGSQVAGKVQGDVDSAKAAQSTAKDTFQGDVDKGSTKYDQGLVDKAVADPSAVANSQPDYDSFVKQRDASYAGPNSFQEDTSAYDPAFSQTQKASQAADASGSEGGRFSLLDQYYGRPTYNKGQKSLDNLLIQNDPNSRDAFAKTKADADATKSNFDSLGQQLSGYAGTAKQTTADAAAKTKAALFGDGGTGANVTGGAIGDLSKSVQDRYNQYSTDANAKAAAAKANLASGAVDPTLMEQYGLTRGTKIYHAPGSQADLSQYIAANAPGSVGSVASPEEAAKAAALAKLGGVENTFIPGVSDAGTYDPNKAVNFDKARFTGDQAAVMGQMNDAVGNTMITDPYSTARLGGGQQLKLPDAISAAQARLDSLTNAKAYDGTGPQHLQDIQSAQQQLQQLMAQKTAIEQQYGGTDSTALGGSSLGPRITLKPGTPGVATTPDLDQQKSNYDNLMNSIKGIL